MFPAHERRAIPEIVGEVGLLVEVASADFTGTLVGITAKDVTLRDRRGRTRQFARTPGAFIVDDRRVTLLFAPADREVATPTVQVTASGSTAVTQDARVARPSRIFVEGIHDAQLLEQVWGDDFRTAGVVVEPLHGADDLARHVAAFAPSATRRLAVLLDHLTVGTKEFRLKQAIDNPHVLIVGHRFVDIFAAVKPERLGLEAWPDVPRGEDYKTGLATRLGYADATALFRAVAAVAQNWTDFDQSLIRSVEEALDFVTLEDYAP